MSGAGEYGLTGSERSFQGMAQHLTFTSDDIDEFQCTVIRTDDMRLGAEAGDSFLPWKSRQPVFCPKLHGALTGGSSKGGGNLRHEAATRLSHCLSVVTD